MNYLDLMVIPAAFTVVNAIFMLVGNTKPFVDGKRQTAGFRVAAFVMCTLLAIAFAEPIG
jgi:hypothetical protein